MPAIKEEMPWLGPGYGVIQQDGASVYTGKGMKTKLNRAEREEEWEIKMVTQPAQSPDLNINDRETFVFLKSRVYGEHFGIIDELVEGIKSMFYGYVS